MARWGERGWKNSWWRRVAGKGIQQKGMEEAAENGKESSHSARANGMNEWTNERTNIEERVNTKFLGLKIYNHLNWQNRVEKWFLSYVRFQYDPPYRFILHIFSYKIWNILGGVILRIVGRYSFYKRKSSRSVDNAWPRTLCRSLYKQWEILPVPCQCIFALMNLVVNSEENFQIYIQDIQCNIDKE